MIGYVRGYGTALEVENSEIGDRLGGGARDVGPCPRHGAEGHLEPSDKGQIGREMQGCAVAEPDRTRARIRPSGRVDEGRRAADLQSSARRHTDSRGVRQAGPTGSGDLKGARGHNNLSGAHIGGAR